jgi:hypothetical protein
MAELYETLSPLERDFFNSLDCEVAKVDQFFIARERDALLRVSALREQLHELKHHRKLFYVSTFIYDGRPLNRTHVSRSTLIGKVDTSTSRLSGVSQGLHHL